MAKIRADKKRRGGRRGGAQNTPVRREERPLPLTPTPDPSEALETPSEASGVTPDPLPEGADEQFGDSNEDISFEVPELLNWKLVAKNATVEKLAANIRQPIVARIQRELQVAVQKALASDSDYRRALEDRDAVVVEIADLFREDLPEGYKATEFNADDMRIIFAFKPFD